MENKNKIEESGYDRLIKCGIRPSVQRLAVINYLMENRIHPTVDKIFNDLYPTMPTLSRTTVYNTLKLLVESGAAIMLTIDERNTRFDAETKPHTHFMCYKCGTVTDLNINPPVLKGNYIDDCEILNSELYLYGHCPECVNKNKN